MVAKKDAVPSFFGVINGGDAHSDSGLKLPSTLPGHTVYSIL
jgi:hypothetical protein